MLPFFFCLFVSRKEDSIQFWKDSRSGMIFKTDVHDAHWELTNSLYQAKLNPSSLYTDFFFGCIKRVKISRVTHKKNTPEAYSYKLFPLSYAKEQD